jgi:hypothetical protein
MAEPTARFFEGMKFMWDGRDYESGAAAEEVKQEYEKDNFETRIVEEDGKFHVYTRRVVTNVEVEGSPPV